VNGYHCALHLHGGVPVAGEPSHTAAGWYTYVRAPIGSETLDIFAENPEDLRALAAACIHAADRLAAVIAHPAPSGDTV
jgi:hypothetical protein